MTCTHFGLLVNENLLLCMKYCSTFAEAIKNCICDKRLRLGIVQTRLTLLSTCTLIVDVFRKVLSHGQSRASAKPGVRPKPLVGEASNP